jgi:hypothetical protein
MEQSRSLDANSDTPGQKNSSSFMEPKGSLPFSQQPATGLQAEPDDSNPHSHTLVP